MDYAIKYHIDIVNLQEIAPPKQSNGENEGIWKELQTHPRLLKHFDVFVEHGLRKRGIATFIRKSKKILCPGEELAGKDKEGTKDFLVTHFTYKGERFYNVNCYINGSFTRQERLDATTKMIEHTNTLLMRHKARPCSVLWAGDFNLGSQKLEEVIASTFKRDKFVHSIAKMNTAGAHTWFGGKRNGRTSQHARVLDHAYLISPTPVKTRLIVPRRGHNIVEGVNSDHQPLIFSIGGPKRPRGPKSEAKSMINQIGPPVRVSMTGSALQNELASLRQWVGDEEDVIRKFFQKHRHVIELLKKRHIRRFLLTNADQIAYDNALFELADLCKGQYQQELSNNAEIMKRDVHQAAAMQAANNKIVDHVILKLLECLYGVFEKLYTTAQSDEEAKQNRDDLQICSTLRVNKRKRLRNWWDNHRTLYTRFDEYACAEINTLENQTTLFGANQKLSKTFVTAVVNFYSDKYHDIRRYETAQQCEDILQNAVALQEGGMPAESEAEVQRAMRTLDRENADDSDRRDSQGVSTRARAARSKMVT